MDGFNRKGQVAFVALMLGIVTLLLVLALSPGINDVITGDDVMGEDGLNCSNTNITNQRRAECEQTDSLQWVFFGVLAGSGFFLIRRVMG